MILEDILSDKQSKLFRLEEYLLRSESITKKESEKLLKLIEEQHYLLEIEIYKRIEKRIISLNKKWDEIIHNATKKVVKAKKEGKSTPIIKSLMLKVDNYKMKKQMEVAELIAKAKDKAKRLKTRVDANKAVIIGKKLSKKYPKGKYVVAGTAAAGAGYAANKIYQNYMTKAARLCAGKEGQDKQNCIKKYKDMAKKAKS